MSNTFVYTVCVCVYIYIYAIICLPVEYLHMFPFKYIWNGHSLGTSIYLSYGRIHVDVENYGFPVRTIYIWFIFHLYLNGCPLGMQINTKKYCSFAKQ